MLSSTLCRWSPSEKKKRAALVTLLGVRQLISHVLFLFFFLVYIAFFELLYAQMYFNNNICIVYCCITHYINYRIYIIILEVHLCTCTYTEYVVIFSKRYKLFLDVMLYIAWPLCYILLFYLIFFLCTIRQHSCNKVNLPWCKEGSLSAVYIANMLWHRSYKLDFMSQLILYCRHTVLG